MKILIPVGCRSDDGLSSPVIKRLSDKHIPTTVLNLDPGRYIQSYCITEAHIIGDSRPDIALIFGDRIEMTAAAAACFNNNVPIAHVYAGVNNNIATLDDINRHAITAWSDIQFCESKKAAEKVYDLLSTIGKDTNIYVVGITHLDDLEISEDAVPDVPYDLVLYNPITYGKDLKQKTWDGMITISGFVNYAEYTLGRHTVFIIPNPDAGREHILEFHSVMKKTAAGAAGMYSWHPDLPRPLFLGLLKNCERFITNSSAAIYEAPHFLEPRQIIQIGDRNRGRDSGPFKIGASDRIVEVLKKWSGEYA